LLSIGSDEHNIVAVGSGYAFYTDGAGDYQGKNLVKVEVKRSRYDSHARLKRAMFILASHFSALKP